MKYYCKKCQSYTERNQKKCCLKCGYSLKDAAIAPSTVIAGFKIIKEIGRGENGIVYLAEQTSLNREVALKILPDAKAEDPGFIKAFLKEARAAARLNHPDIVQVYDAGITDEGIYFLAMELIDGKSLEEHLKEKGSLKSEKVVGIALGLARALDYSWTKEHMLHGDIKPENIMMRKNGMAKLADFGLAKTIFEERNEEIMATPMYAPPEVIRAEHKKITCKSDMYSFGVTLYELLCGQPPFDEFDSQKVLDMHLSETHIPLTKRLPGIKASLSEFIDKLLSKDPEERPTDWASVVETLKNIQKTKDKRKTESKFRLTLPLLASIAFALTISSMGIAAYLYYRKSHKRQNPPALIKADKPKTVKIKKPETPPEIKKTDNTAEDQQKKLREKTLLQLADFLKRTENFSGDILTASRLRYEGLLLYRDKFLTKAEKTELLAVIIKLNGYLKERYQAANKLESEKLRSALKQEENNKKLKSENEKTVNKELAEKDKIYKMIASFFYLPKNRQTLRSFQELFNKNHKFDKNLKEYKILEFMLKILPSRYDREGVIFQNLNQLRGQNLPWKINGEVYRIKGGNWQMMLLEKRLSEGVFSRKKLRPSQISDAQWDLLVKNFLIEKNMKLSAKTIRHTACWLLLYSRQELFDSFIRKYYPGDLPNWQYCRQVLLYVPLEIAAWKSWNELSGQLKALDEALPENINNFKSKYASSQVYKAVKNILYDYQDLIDAIYPTAFIEKANLKKLSAASRNATVFSAYIRYRFLNILPDDVQKYFQDIFNKKLHLLFEGQNFSGQNGVFENVPCGKVYSWVMADTKKNKPPSFICYLPALLDIDGWDYIKRSLRKNPAPEISSPALEKDKAYPFCLYSAGIVALRCGRWKLLEKVLAAFKEFSIKNSDSVYGTALYADLAIKARYDTLAWEVLNKYQFNEKPQQNEILIILFKIQALLTRKDVSEIGISELIKEADKRFAGNDAMRADLEKLSLLRQFICAGLKRETVIAPDFFKKTNYPHLHARLWLEAAARDKILHRDSVETASLLKACRSVLSPSAFRSELFYKMSCFELGQETFTPDQLLHNVSGKLLEIEPCASASYPALLMLLFTSTVFDKELPPGKLAVLARNYVTQSPLFSPLEHCLGNILSSADLMKTLRGCDKFNPPVFQKNYLWMLAAAKASRTGNVKEYIQVLKSFKKDLRWTEELFLDRFIQLLENIQGL